MSRAYRVAVKDSLKKIIRGKDGVSTDLELLGILPKEQMSQLLEKELAKEGFTQNGKEMTKECDDVVVSVNTETGKVSVSAGAEKECEVKGTKEGSGYDDVGPKEGGLKKKLKEELKKDLEEKAKAKEQELQDEVTKKLEASLGNIRRELDGVTNRVTAEALKQKAASMGQIKAMDEEPNGSLTIVVEV